MNEQTLDEQRTTGWYEQRAGKPTASRFKDVMDVSKKTGKPLKGRITYAYTLVAERIAGPLPSKGQTWAMKQGADLEPYVRMMYEKQTGNVVEETGFHVSPCGRYGASPDGLVGEDGLVEIKTREPHLFITDLLASPHEVPEDYRWQIIGQCMVTGRKWCDLAQYSLALHAFRIIRYEPTPEEFETLKTELIRFIEEVDGYHREAQELLEEVCIDRETLEQLGFYTAQPDQPT